MRLAYEYQNTKFQSSTKTPQRKVEKKKEITDQYHSRTEMENSLKEKISKSNQNRKRIMHHNHVRFISGIKKLV